MNRLRILVLLVSSLALTTAAPADVIDASLCDVLKDPVSFDGKLVRIKAANVIAGFDDFLVKGPGCGSTAGGALWLAYPEGTGGKAGPAAMVQLQLARNGPAAVAVPKRISVTLEKDKNFKQFDSLLSTPYKSGGICLGCIRYTVEATLVGRLDASGTTGVVRDSSGKTTGVGGFGNLNLYRARLVLQAVSDVTSHEIDYKAKAVAARDEAAGATSPGDTDTGQVQRSAAAFGAPGEDNGVLVGFGGANEASQDESAKGRGDSPDGLIFNARFDMDRLKGDTLAIAMAHVGTHIADLRSAEPVANLHDLEYRAWQTTALSAMVHRLKTLTLPGGFVAMSSTWPAAEQSRRSADAISSFLASWP
jgi:hypothetical protein